MSSQPSIYLDYAATAPLHPIVFKAYQDAYAQGAQFNPSSPHSLGQQAKALLSNARQRVADYFEVPKDSVVFSSGATESNHLALWGLASTLKASQSLITSATEHPSVLAALQTQPYTQAPCHQLPCHSDGTLQLSRLEETL
ncbi:MAG: aminotransferase class V-fold PLP-dependent enzyme, partial [Planctomycetota bacterium]|nr:aminotransferase class V-fold PLP-dependent enzyme [Planctomycetota bacterium]